MMSHLRDLNPVVKLFLAGNRRPLLRGALLSMATVLSGVALLGLSGWFITATAIAGLTTATALAFDVFAPSAGIRFLALTRTAARYGERLTTHDATLRVLSALRERLFRGWAEPGAAAQLLHQPARLLFRLTLDVDALDSLYLRVVVPLGAAIAVAMAAGLVFGLIDPLAGLALAAVLLGAGLGVPLGAARAAQRPTRRRAHALEALRARVIDLVAGQTELAMAGRLPAQLGAVAAADLRLAETDNALNQIETQVSATFGFLSALLLAGALVVLAAFAEGGTIGAPVAALGLLVALAALEPFAALRRGAVDLGRTLLAARRIAPRLAPAQQAPSTPLPPDGFAAQLSRVTVRHPGATDPVLEELSLTIRDGERLALIGPSGAGKSTILKLLAGELPVEQGCFSGHTATLLTQRTELFQDSLRDNLRLAAPRADDARLTDALEAAGLAKDVKALPEGLDMRLGEGGIGLSGGQSRRLALARLLLRDARLWLLDEPTEGLDGTTARDVLARLAARAGQRTVVIATHIRREAAIADRLVIMDRGRITAMARRGETAFDAALSALRPD
ncbi:thiol reductant ABC exporter subunit CydC [Rhodoligotrophos ferricapiens]|uniref:thiol reductant ABC exporter subunit CydC n=1 Tax=Rhodoligotrophos ferricapiens TaxID=3069264 RepID=UPI00315DF306